jgi:nicotinate-nucleotide pyrophosphorylase (carboxylating)
LEVNFSCKDGDIIEDVPACIGVISGKLSSILQIERLLLNTMQRMSGIATLTKQYVQLAQATGIDIYDTRKTTPNFRLPEKWAVVIGGGVNHRFGLDDQILIKDNHIKAAGDIQSALDNCLAYCNQQNIQIPVIVEVKNEQEFLTALKHSIVNRILIDNHSPEVLEKYIQYRNSIAPTKKLEISGGINLDNIKPYLIPGIDCISVGALTHHAISVDISLKIV